MKRTPWQDAIEAAFVVAIVVIGTVAMMLYFGWWVWP